MNKLIVVMIVLEIALSHARVYVEVMNRLENGRRMNIHCRSREDDLGYHVLEGGGATDWSFNVNLLGTTLFYCDVQWGDSVWFHFDAFDANRDSRRCKTVCRWMISDDQGLMLFGYNQGTGFWERFPMFTTIG